jgi:predicted DCC family thiol-disulfide oxidoreductase YuxK
MVSLPMQSVLNPHGVHLVLYDGVCGLCNRLLQFVLRHDRWGVFVFAALQSATGQAVIEGNGGNPHDLKTFYVLANYRTQDARLFTRSDAALFVAGELGWPWRAIRVMRVAPQGLRDRVYDLVARIRYRFFGKYEQCLLPRPEFRNRFVD